MSQVMKTGISTVVMLVIMAAAAGSASAALYERAGWVADVTGAFHSVAFIATIVDERTIDVRGFDYDASAPLVYFWLATGPGTLNQGLAAGDQLRNNGVGYVDDRVRLILPQEMSLDTYTVLSVWCAQFGVNFGSGPFVPDPSPPPAGDLDDSGTVDTQDINPFIAALVDLGGYYDVYPGATVVPDLVADVNGDGTVNTEDINPFIAALTGGSTASAIVPEPATATLMFLGMVVAGRRRSQGRYNR